MKTISVLREELAAAQAAYLAADIEHPTQSVLAKEYLANARHEYQHACVELLESIIGIPESREGWGEKHLAKVISNILEGKV